MQLAQQAFAQPGGRSSRREMLAAAGLLGAFSSMVESGLKLFRRVKWIYKAILNEFEVILGEIY